MFLDRGTTIIVGELGHFRFPRGYYLYIGSSMNGLDARVRRHLTLEKKLHWHIDYFLAYARVVGIWVNRGERRLECAWAARLLALDNAHVVGERLGASDCKCRTHLIHLIGQSEQIERKLYAARRMVGAIPARCENAGKKDRRRGGGVDYRRR